MTRQNTSPAFALICDRQGRICRVLWDDASLFPSHPAAHPFLQCVSEPSQEIARAFLGRLLTGTPAAGEGIRISSPDNRLLPFFCTGFPVRNYMAIIGAQTPEGALNLFLSLIRNDRLSTTGCPGEDRTGKPGEISVDEHHLYGELSRVNNELVTLQRNFVEAQIEIEMQSDELRAQIAEREKAEAALNEASRKLSMLSSITRHDILNQIMGLRTFLELSRETATDPVLLGYIEKEDHAAEAIQRQIEFTRYYQDIGAQAPKWRKIKDALGEAWSQLNPDNISFSLLIPDIEVFSDALIEKVFYNLMENSVRHGGHATTMEFSVRESEAGLVIIYRDNGTGISAGDKTRLFQKGFGKHTGLGLFLSREILAITGITITETGIPGQGVQFEILVPRGDYRFSAGS